MKRMKQTVKAMVITVMCVIMSSFPCFAAEGNVSAKGIPEVIEVEGGRLELVDPSVADGARMVQPRYAYRVVTAGGNLNVRSGPGTNYSVVGQFKNGQVIDISFWQDATIAPWEYATGKDCNTGKSIGGYVHGSYIGDY